MSKIFISVDLEGITDVISWDETMGTSTDYQYFRKLMTLETNAAIEGVLEAGATDIIIRDAHGNARNIIPDLLHKQTRLIREWSTGPYGMMEGIDESFDAVLCIGYHAKANTENATLKHTMSGVISDLKLNGVSLPELGWNALIAGYHNVPIIFVSGDKAICDQASSLIPGIEVVAVKEGIGKASINLHPTTAQELIKQGACKALKHIKQHLPYKLSPPFKMELSFKGEDKAFRASWYPNTERIDELTVSFVTDNFFECMRFFTFSY